MPTTQPSIRVTKHFDYRGNPDQLWSNRYFFDGAAPADDAAWHTLFDGWVLVEKTIHAPDVHIVKVEGYNGVSDIAAASQTYDTGGTLATSGSVECPGDCAVVLRMATTKRSTKGHTVYVFSYFHRALIVSSGAQPDQVFGAQKSAVEAFADDLVSGVTIGGRTYKRTTPDGHLVTGRHVDPWVGHRDFPR